MVSDEQSTPQETSEPTATAVPQAPDADAGAAPDAPAAEAPAAEAPAVEAPAVEAPAVEAPAVDAPTADTPAADAPVEAAPTADAAAPTADAPAADAPVEAAPTADAAAPTADAPAADAPVEAAPTADAPAPAADAAAPTADAAAPTADAPAADAPVEAAPAANAPAADAPAADASAQAAPTADASAAIADAASNPGTDGEAAAADTSDGPRKKQRRRRRKKKPDGEAGDAPAAEGAAAEGRQKEGNRSRGEGRSKAEPNRPKRKTQPERPAFNVGDEIFGVVSRADRFALLLNVAGGKAVGLYDCAELIQIPPKLGEKFTGKVKSVSTRGGMLLLGREPFDIGKARTELREALDKQEPLECWVTGVIKGGLEVDYMGVRAFAPASHVDLKPNADFEPLLGTKMSFIVSQYAKKGRDVVVSRKKMLMADFDKVREEHLAKLEPDAICKGVVRNVLNWGAFVALPEHGNIEGVVHMSEASHRRGARLGEVLKVGEEIEVKVLRVDDKGKLWLSRKATLTDPWDAAKEKYTQGSYHNAKVVRLTDFGAFLQLEPGIDGLCHVADLAYKQVEHPKDVVKVGDSLDVVIANLDNKARKVTLHPAPPEAERGNGRLHLKPYMSVKAEVMEIRERGLGVRILGATGRSQRGFIPAGQTGTARGTDLRKGFPLGEVLDVKVLEADPRRGDARLSIRALKDDAEKQAYRDYRKKVQRESSFGTFADLLKKS